MHWVGETSGDESEDKGTPSEEHSPSKSPEKVEHLRRNER